MDRKTEIRNLLKLSPQQIIERAAGRLIVCSHLDILHRHLAEDIAGEIRSRSAEGHPTRLILPVGPTGQYPILADIINRERLSLADCRFFFMDEYCDDDGNAVTSAHPLSFKAVIKALFLDRLHPALFPPPGRIIFPDESNLQHLAKMIEEAGGIDVCYGGIGIHGHVAFNEPQPGVRETGPRRVMLNDFTITINTVRAGIGGNLECFPRYAYTLGMRQILGAKKIRLYCRNGCEFDWANTVLRIALLGATGDDYPVTYVRDHDYMIITDEDTLRSPRNLI